MSGPSTESANPRSKGIDSLSESEMLRLMLEEEQASVCRIADALPAIERAVKDAVAHISEGGMVCYAGAGTSGRLGVLDASEIPPTFGRGPFKAIIAGGMDAVTRAIEGAEDDERAGYAEGQRLTSKDMALGIAASGRTPFVHGFLKGAKDKGARTWLLACTQFEPKAYIDDTITLMTGPELIAGSTRMKAGTATKIALNMLSTATMVRLGGSYDGLMVDVMPTNAKLLKRAVGIVMRIANCSEEEARSALEASGMRPKVAAVMVMLKVSAAAAEARLSEHNGSLRKTLSA